MDWLASWATTRGGKTGICPPPRKIETKNQKCLGNLKPAASELILAMTVLFADMKLTLHKCRADCSGVMH